MFDITGNSTLSTPFYIAMLTVGSNPGANMRFGHFIQEVGAVNWTLNHQSSFVKKWKAPRTLHGVTRVFLFKYLDGDWQRKYLGVILLSCFPWNAAGRLVRKISAFPIGVCEKQSRRWSRRGRARRTRKTRLCAIPAGWQPPALLPSAGDQFGTGAGASAGWVFCTKHQRSAGPLWHLRLQPGSVGKGIGKPALGVVANSFGWSVSWVLNLKL